MMKIRIIFYLVCITLSTQSMGMNKVIYGRDNRIDPIDSSNSLFIELSLSTAAMVRPSAVKKEDEYSVISGITLEEYGVCKTEKYSNQVAVADCSGFLVGEDLLVTAGHCIQDQSDCDNNIWVFDYKVDGVSDPSKVAIPTSSIYGCKKILERKLERDGKNDYALIQLDRKVNDRLPLKFRKSGKIDNKAKLVLIGHPTGLPTKISDDAYIRSNSNSIFFVTNTDSFGGNSGSAVFNADTGEVEGILVRGENDYDYNTQKGCQTPTRCKMNTCRGEDATRITNIKYLQQL